MDRITLAFLTACLLGTCRIGFGIDPPQCYDIVEIPVVPPDYYEQMAASYEQMAAAYEKLASEYHNSCGTFSIGGDYLYWHADNDILQYAIDGIGTNIEGQAYVLNPEWSSGFRVDAGYCFPCDDWQLNFTWTHYESNTSETTTPAAGLLLYSTRGNPAAGFTTVIRADAAWNLKINTLQADLSYTFWTRFHLSLIPRIGIRSDQITDKFDITYLVAVAPTTEIVNIHQSIRSVGPVVGLGSEWNFYRNLSFFSDFQWAALVSFYNVSYVVDVVQAVVTSDINTRDKKHISKQTMNLNVGFKWEYRINSRSGLIIKAGWENLVWLDYGETFYFVDSVADGINVRATNDLHIHGLTLRAEMFF